MELGSFSKVELGLPEGLGMLDSAAESGGCWGKRFQENRAGPWTTYSGTTCLICGFTYPSAAFAAGEKSNVNRSPQGHLPQEPIFSWIRTKPPNLNSGHDMVCNISVCWTNQLLSRWVDVIQKDHTEKTDTSMSI